MMQYYIKEDGISARISWNRICTLYNNLIDTSVRHELTAGVIIKIINTFLRLNREEGKECITKEDKEIIGKIDMQMIDQRITYSSAIRNSIKKVQQ